MTTDPPNEQAGDMPVDTNKQMQEEFLHQKKHSEVDSGPETSSASAKDHQLTIRVGQTDYVCTISEDQWIRMKSIIPPKPVPSDLDRAQITADHIDAVLNVWQLLLNRMNSVIKEHDSRKLKQTEEEHHMQEPHHWPLDGYDTSDGYLPLQYVAEAVCDYLATMFGRAFAGREFGYLPPTNQITAADVLGATCIDLLVTYDLASVTPAPKIPGGTESED